MTKGQRYLAWISDDAPIGDLRSWCGDHLGTQATSSDLADGDWYLARCMPVDAPMTSPVLRWAILTRNHEDHALARLTWS